MHVTVIVVGDDPKKVAEILKALEAESVVVAGPPMPDYDKERFDALMRARSEGRVR